MTSKFMRMKQVAEAQEQQEQKMIEMSIGKGIAVGAGIAVVSAALGVAGTMLVGNMKKKKTENCPASSVEII